MASTYTPGNAALQGALHSGLTVPSGITWDGQQLVIANRGGDELWTLAQNADGTYTPGNAALQGVLPNGIGDPLGITWDGQQLVIADITGEELWTLARNANGTYTPANASLQGALPSGLTIPQGITWDGQQLVIADDSGDELWTLARNANRTYTPGNSTLAGVLPHTLVVPSGITWDGQQLVIANKGGDELWTLAQNADGTYTPGNAALQGVLPNGIGDPNGMTWDGQQLVIVDDMSDELWTLKSDNSAPAISAITATPAVIDHAATSSLEAIAMDPDPVDTLSYQWVSSVGGAFSSPMSATTNWTAPSGRTNSFAAILTCTVTDLGNLTDSGFVQVAVRAQGAGALSLPAVGDRSGATGDVVNVIIASEATGGRSPYTYAFTDLPTETGAVGRRIRGRLITPGTFTVTMTVTDANGDTDSQDFDWVVTGTAIAPPTGINVRIDWGDASFSRTEADVTGRLISGIACDRGLTTTTATRGRTVAGQLTFDLDNSDGLYDLENTSSTLHGQIRPGIAVQLRDAGDPLWTGVLDGIPTTYEDSGRHRARVTALGIWSTLRDATVSVGSLEPTATAQAVIEILEEAAICGFPVGSGFFIMNRWWELGRLQEAIRDMEDTEGGLSYERRQGDIGFQSGGWRASRTLAATFSGLPVLLSGEHAIIGRPNRQIAIKDVVNQVVGFVREFETETAQTVFRREEAVAIGLGTSVFLVSDFEEDGAVLSIDTPVAGTGYTASRNADGTGANDTSRLTLTATISQFNEVQVEVIYPTQGGNEPSEVFLTTANLKGTVLRRLPPDKVNRRAATSITRFKRKTLELRETWINNQQAMRTRADALLAQLGDSEIRVEFDWIVEDYADFTALEISDLIRLKLPSYTDDAYIENLALRIPLSGKLPVCTVQATVVR